MADRRRKKHGLTWRGARRMCAKQAFRVRRAGDGKVRRMARTMRASSPHAHGCAVGEPRRLRVHAGCREIKVTGFRIAAARRPEW